jgi:hypothetical protein
MPPGAVTDEPSGPAPAAPASGRSRPPVGLIVGAVFAAAAVLLVALSIPLLLQQFQAGPESQYAVGDCVVQDGDQARMADCREPDAYRITLQVDAISDCPDLAQPAITVSEPAPSVFCLAPAQDPATAEE